MFKHNPLLQAVIVPAAIGTAAYSLKTIISYIYKTYVAPLLYSYITIRSADSDYYDAVLEFIQARKLLKANHFMACKPKALAEDRHARDHETLPGVRYMPADSGTTVSVLYKGTTIYISRRSGETLIVGHERKMVKLETLCLSVLGTDSTIIKSFISDAIERVNNIKTGRIRILVPDTWSVAQAKKPRLLDTLILDKSISKELIDDARTFLESKKWYEEMGIPHRRGYLLHGPPGCGKTSLCQVLAGLLKLDICILSLSDRFMTDTSLSNLLLNAPLRSIILLEDIDSIFTQRKKNPDFSSRLTFSGLLNAIDGVSSQEGRITIMTTNCIDDLDPALLRPGRCDIKVLISNASSEQLAAMFIRFFPGRDDDARSFAHNIPAGELSLAQIQGHLVRYKNSAEEAVQMAAEFAEKCLVKNKP